jgi:succinate dehydrogenase/fumarate reductase cytochrome b subunit
LRFTQHFTGTADFQVMHGQVETAAEFFHGLNGIQTLLCLLGQALQIGHQ